MFKTFFFSIFVIAGLVMTAFVSCYDTYMNWLFIPLGLLFVDAQRRGKQNWEWNQESRKFLISQRHFHYNRVSDTREYFDSPADISTIIVKIFFFSKPIGQIGIYHFFIFWTAYIRIPWKTMDSDAPRIQSTVYENKNVWDLGLLKRDFILSSRSFKIQMLARTSSPTGQRSSRSTSSRRYGLAIEISLWIMGDLLISLEGPNDCVWGHWYLSRPGQHDSSYSHCERSHHGYWDLLCEQQHLRYAGIDSRDALYPLGRGSLPQTRPHSHQGWAQWLWICDWKGKFHRFQFDQIFSEGKCLGSLTSLSRSSVPLWRSSRRWLARTLLTPRSLSSTWLCTVIPCNVLVLVSRYMETQ